MKKGSKHSKEAIEKMRLVKNGITFPNRKRPPKFTDEHRRNMSDGVKKSYIGRKAPMLGRKHTEESKLKVSKNNAKYWLGKERSEDTKEKIGKSLIGNVISKETREKLSRVLTGKKRSLETRKKMSESKKGNKCYFWKGGVTRKNLVIRSGLDHRLWREAVFCRDYYTCQRCNKRGGELNPHHILNFSSHVELRFAIDNGITMCKKCHSEFHKKYGNRNNDRRQLEEFIRSL